MRAVWKFGVEIQATQIIQMPEGARILCVQTQNDNPFLWAMVETQNRSVIRRFAIHGTGHPLSEYETVGVTEKYIGTVQTDNGKYVWHLFEQVEQ